MADPREQILERLKAIAGEIDGGSLGTIYPYRNAAEVGRTRRPAIVILDADESADPRADPSRRPSNTINLVDMRPEVLLMVASSSANVGTDLNDLRVRLIKAVLFDAELNSLASQSGGGIAYLGAATDFARERSMSGEMTVSFNIRYRFDPNSL